MNTKSVVHHLRILFAGVGLTCLLAVGIGISSMRAASPLQKVWVTITAATNPGDPPSVDTKEKHISKKAEELCWKLKGGTHFQVNFPGETPFGSNHIFTDAAACSGAVTVQPDSNKVYKYEVTVDGSKPLDPGVIVDP